MATIGKVVVRITADNSALERKLRSASASVQRFGKRAGEVGRTISQRMTLPLVVAGAAVIKMSLDFQRSMNRVQALTGATGQQFEDLDSLARRLGETTEFSASQAAQGMGFLAQAGFKVNEILAALPGTLQLASAGQLSLASAADIASNILTQFGLKAEEIGRVNDVLAKTASSANVNVFQLSEAMKFVGTTAAKANRPIEEVAAALGLLGGAGLQGTIGGTALNRALINMIKPADQAKKALNKLNVSVLDASGRLLPLADVVQQVERSILSGGITARESGLVFEAFGLRGGRAINALVGQGRQLEQFTQQLRAAGGTAERIQRIQLKGLVGAVAEFRSALEGAVLSISRSGFQSSTERMIRKLTDFTRSIGGAGQEALQFGTILATALAAAGPALVGLFVAMKGVAIIAKILVSRLLLVPSAVVGVGLAATELAKGARSLEEVLSGMKATVDSFVSTIKESLGGAFDDIFGKIPETPKLPQLPTPPELGGEALASGALSSGGLVVEITKGNTKIIEFTRNLRQNAEAVELEARLFGKSAGVIAAARVEQELKNLTQAENIKLTVEQRQRLEEYTNRLKTATNKLEENRRKTEAINGAARDLGFTFSSAFEDAIVKGRGLRDVLHGLLQDIQRILVRKVITERLTGFITGGLGGLFGGAAPTPTPLQLSGPFQHGGSFTVGGRGGTDRNLVSFAASKGERVDVLTRRQQMEGGRGAGGPTFFLDMRGSLVSVDAIAELKRLVRAVNGSIETRAVSAVADARKRNPRLFGLKTG